MDLVGDERAQSIQIGAVLLFAVLIIAFSSYQAFVVPNQNRQVEYNHNQEVQTQMQDLRNALVSVSDGTGGSSVSVQLGTQYPSRAIAQNPGPPSGTLRTVGTGDGNVDLTISNAQASGETGDFWDSSDRSYNTGGIAYQPQYNLYTVAPVTVYENTILYNSFRSGNLTVANQSFIDGTEISLVTVDGSLSQSSRGTTTVDVEPVSTSTQTVPLEAESSSDPITITFASTRSADYWDFLVDTQSTVTGVTDSGPTDGFYEVSVTLDTDRTYQLQMTEVGVGTGVTTENTAYMTDVDGGGTTLSQNETTELTLEVRDQLNNPPANATATTVTAEVAGEGSLSSTSATPDADGEVTFEYTAPDDTTGTQNIRFTYGSLSDGTFDESTPQDVVVSVDVRAGGSGSGSDSAGTGGESNYSTGDDTETVSDANGRWEGITYTDQMRFSNLETVIIRNQGVDRFVNGMTVRNESDATPDYGIYFSIQRSPDGTISTSNNHGTVYILRYEPGNINTLSATLTDDAQSDLFNDDVYNGTNILNPDSYTDNSLSSGFVNRTDNITQMDDTDTVVVFSNSTGRADLTLWDRTLIRAVQTDPVDDDDEFVALHFRTPVNTTGWTLETETESMALPEETLSDTVYFAANPTTFADEYSLDSRNVYSLDMTLTDSAESLTLIDAEGQWRDEFAQGSTDTSNGWSLAQLGEEEVASRNSSAGGYINSENSSYRFFQDNDTALNWEVRPDSEFFPRVPGDGVAFTVGGTDELRTYSPSTGVTSYPGVDNVGGVGSKTVNFYGGPESEVPFVNSSGLYVVNETGDRAISTSGNILQQDVAVGDYENDGDSNQEVYWISGNGKVTYGSVNNCCTSGIANGNPNTNAIAGLGDIDGDGGSEVVHYDDTNGLRYIGYDGSNNVDSNIPYGGGVGTSPAYGLGPPTDFADDSFSNAAIPVVDTSGNIRLVGVNGNSETILSDGSARSTSLATFDVIDDSSPEIIYVEDSTGYLTALNVETGETTTLTDDGGTEITVSDGGGPR